MAVVAWKFKKNLITKELKNVGDGKTETVEWAPDIDGKLVAILVNRADGQPFTGSLMTIERVPDKMTVDSLPVITLGSTWFDHMPLEENAPKGVKWKFAFTNKEGVTITAYITLVVTPP